MRERLNDPAIGDVIIGLYRGIVVNNLDKEGLLRILVKVPAITGDAALLAMPCIPAPAITAVLPEPGDPIWVMFEGGDIDHPVWMGTWLTATTRQELVSVTTEIDALTARIVTLEHTMGIVDYVGRIDIYAGGTIPPIGWLLCNGSAISRATYADLFAAIGTAWGAGNGTTTFNIPDLRGKAPIGAGTGSGLTARTLGATNIGEETHLLTVSEIASHNHTQNAHHHKVDETPTVSEASGFGIPASTATFQDRAMVHSVALPTDSEDTTPTNNASGGGGTHNNMQPSAVVNFIIRTGLS